MSFVSTTTPPGLLQTEFTSNIQRPPTANDKPFRKKVLSKVNMINKSINQVDEEIRPSIENVMRNKQCRSSPDSHGVVCGDSGRVGYDAV